MLFIKKDNHYYLFKDDVVKENGYLDYYKKITRDKAFLYSNTTISYGFRILMNQIWKKKQKTFRILQKLILICTTVLQIYISNT